MCTQNTRHREAKRAIISKNPTLPNEFCSFHRASANFCDGPWVVKNGKNGDKQEESCQECRRLSSDSSTDACMGLIFLNLTFPWFVRRTWSLVSAATTASDNLTLSKMHGFTFWNVCTGKLALSWLDSLSHPRKSPNHVSRTFLLCCHCGHHRPHAYMLWMRTTAVDCNVRKMSTSVSRLLLRVSLHLLHVPDLNGNRQSQQVHNTLSRAKSPSSFFLLCLQALK